MRCLVTGGAGFIGSHLVERLIGMGFEVHVFDDFSSNAVSLHYLQSIGAKTIPCDVSEICGNVDESSMHGWWRLHPLGIPGLVLRNGLKFDTVFHLAAWRAVEQSVESPALVTKVNVLGTANMLQAAMNGRTKRFVFVSSSSVYGVKMPGQKCKLDDRLSPVSPYAATKVAGEALVASFKRTFGMEVVIVRPFNVYGPRQSPQSRYAAVVPLWIKACLEGKPMVVHGDGKQMRDFTYVEDVVSTLLMAGVPTEDMARPGVCPGSVLNAGAGNPVSILDLGEMIAAACGVEAKFEHVAERPGDVPYTHAADPYYSTVPLKLGIAETVKWMKGT